MEEFCNNCNSHGNRKTTYSAITESMVKLDLNRYTLLLRVHRYTVLQICKKKK